jgi:hypothetical protein
MAATPDLKTREQDAARGYHFIPRSLRRVARKTWLDIKHRGDKDNALPDFYIIGSMKSGTTALYMHLEHHPDIVPATQKEVHYFNTHRDLGERFFRSNFPPVSALEARDNVHGRQITGEATPDYIFHPSAPAMCKAITPNARFVLLMRNPIERAYSHWKQGKRFAFESEDFDTAIALEDARMEGEAEKLLADPHFYSYRHQMYSYLHRGYYADQIKEWLKHFDRDQFLFIQSEDLFENGLTVFDRVSKFLGVSDWHPEEFSLLFKGLEGEISPEARARLQDHFAPRNAELYELVGEDYGWK